MLQEARNNIQRAVIGKGPLQFVPEFSHLECSEQQWMEMTPAERRKHLAKFDPFVGIGKLCKSDAILPMPSIGNSSQSFSSKSHETMEIFSSEDEESFKWEDVPDLRTSASEVKEVSSSEGRGSSRWVVLPSVTSTYISSTITSPGSSTDGTNKRSSLGESACARNIGQFQDSGLPEYLKGSWINAQKIIDKNGVGSFPGSESKRVVISSSPPLRLILTILVQSAAARGLGTTFLKKFKAFLASSFVRGVLRSTTASVYKLFIRRFSRIQVS